MENYTFKAYDKNFTITFTCEMSEDIASIYGKTIPDLIDLWIQTKTNKKDFLQELPDNSEITILFWKDPPGKLESDSKVYFMVTPKLPAGGYTEFHKKVLSIDYNEYKHIELTVILPYQIQI